MRSKRSLYLVASLLIAITGALAVGIDHLFLVKLYTDEHGAYSDLDGLFFS